MGEEEGKALAAGAEDLGHVCEISWLVVLILETTQMLLMIAASKV